ncbi:hypothetical protein CDAR_253791 [Caerostris darwini]|uniref:Uncharacterized protein n=1 Tax=Caerostris darwini TaxID=1538125 RepID=A0AAV4Q570_9ARAC|nr:hypothetical protein CDAR_253791 [Caerostris darwini]
MSLIESSSLSSATKTAKNKTRRRMHWNGTLQSHNELQAISSPDKRVLSSGVHVCRLAARAFFLTLIPPSFYVPSALEVSGHSFDNSAR